MEETNVPGMVTDAFKNHPSWVRLEDQLRWYDEKSRSNQARYQQIKILQIISAALIPFLSLMVPEPQAKYVSAFLGVVITVTEGIQQLYQFNTLWIQYRSTAEGLQHERFLFLGKAGAYRGNDIDRRLLLLSDRVEALISTENAKWISNEEKINQKP